MIKAYGTYDTPNETWNVVTHDRECLFFGTAEQVDEWFEDHKLTHIEEQ